MVIPDQPDAATLMRLIYRDWGRHKTRRHACFARPQRPQRLCGRADTSAHPQRPHTAHLQHPHVRMSRVRMPACLHVRADVRTHICTSARPHIRMSAYFHMSTSPCVGIFLLAC